MLKDGYRHWEIIQIGRKAKNDVDDLRRKIADEVKEAAKDLEGKKPQKMLAI